MKFIITESAIKDFIKYKFGVDLSNNFEMVTNYEDLPHRFKRLIPPKMVNQYLNYYGPMYVIKNNDDIFLYQKQNELDMFVNKHDEISSESEILDSLGVGKLGIPIDDLISIYFNE